MILNKYLSVLLTIILIGFTLRAWKLTISPMGLYIDETSIGYNAFSLISTGRDEYGKFMPLFFEAFGEYKLPVYIYSVAIIQFLIGPTDLSVRLPAVIFGTLTIPFIFFLSKELLRNNSNQTLKLYVPYLAAFLLSISPWHFQFSRPGFEASVGLFFLTLALYTFFKALRKKTTFILILSILSFVITLYSYNSARIVTPVVLLTLLILYYKDFPLLTWIKVLLIAGIIALPFLKFAFSPEGLVRAKQVSIFFQPIPNAIIKQFLLNYWANISPFYLFLKGDPTIAHLTPYRMSLLYLVESPFFFIGFAMLFIKRSREYFFVLILLLTAFVPPAISTLNPHALRAVLVLPATVLISAIGFGYLLTFIRNNNFKNLLLVFYILILSLSFLRFLNIYHNKYAINAGWDWQVDAKQAALKVLQIQRNYDDIYFNGGLRTIAVAWYLKYDPILYQQSIDKNNLGKYHFGIDSWELIPRNGKNLYVTNASIPDGRLLEYIYYPNGDIAYGIWEI